MLYGSKYVMQQLITESKMSANVRCKGWYII